MLVLSIIATILVAAPSAASAQRVGRWDRGRYELDHFRVEARARERARVQAADRAAHAERRAEARAESRAYESRRRIEREHRRDDRAIRVRDRNEARRVERARTRYRW
jgi:Ni/Co efflux regulator RcnB